MKEILNGHSDGSMGSQRHVSLLGQALTKALSGLLGSSLAAPCTHLGLAPALAGVK